MRQNNTEYIRKVEEILDDILSKREDVNTTNPLQQKKRCNVSFCGKVGANVKFSGVRISVLAQDYGKYKSNINNINCGATHVNMKYFDEKNNQYQPLCYIHTVRQNLPDMNMSSDIDFVPFYNSHEFRAKDYYLNRQDFDYLKTKEVSKTKIQTGSNQFRKLFVYHSIDENSCSLIDEIVNIINQSKEKSVNVEKRKKLNIHSIIDLITTQDDGQEK